jgi:hypothetical protein
MGDVSDLQGGENCCKELLRRFYEYWDDTFDTVEGTENTAPRQRDFCTRTRLGQTVGPLSTASVQRTTQTSHSVWAIAHPSIMHSSKLPHTCSTRESAYSLLLN